MKTKFIENINKKMKEYFLAKSKHALVFFDMKWAHSKNFYSKRTQHILRWFIVMLLLIAVIIGILSLFGQAIVIKTATADENIANPNSTYALTVREYVDINKTVTPFVGLIYGSNQSQLSWGIGLTIISFIGALAQLTKLYGKNAGSNNFVNALTNQIAMIIGVGLLSNSYALIPLIFAMLIQGIVTYHAVAVTHLKKPMFEVAQKQK